MKTVARRALALVVPLGGVVAVAAPASAVTPQIYVTDGPYTRDQSVAILGVGCPTGAPVSVDVWDTAKPASHVVRNAIATAAGSNGAFGYSFDLDNQFDAGAQVGFYFSCTATLDWSWDSASASTRTTYEWISVSSPHAEIIAPATATYGLSRDVWVSNDAVLGNVVLTLDGAPVPADLTAPEPTSHYGAWLFHLPAGLSVGTHALHVTWTPQAPGSPTVTDDATLRITRLRPRLSLSLSDRTVRRTQWFSARVRLSGTRIAPRTGTVVIKDGTRVVIRFTLRASDAGTRSVRIRLSRLGTRNVTATYLGSARLTSVRTPVITVRVRR